MPDSLHWRRVWFTTRKGSNARRSRFCINWISDDGRPARLCYPTRATARQAARLREQALNSWAASPEARAWSELLVEYGMTLIGLSANHQNKVARVLGRFQSICRPTQSNLITPAQCDRFMAARTTGDEASDRLAPSAFTLRDERAILSAFFAWCVNRGYMPDNPMKHVRVPRTPRRHAKPPAPSEWVKLLEALLRPDLPVHDPQAWHLLILLGVASGFRRSVLLHCYFGFDLTDRKRLELLERRHRRDGGFSVVQLADADGIGLLFTYSGKTLKENVTGIPKIVADRITARIADLPAGAVGLFPWACWQRKAWKRINAAAGLNLTFQSLRSACGTQAAVAKAVQSASRQLEHSSTRVTREHYLDPEVLARAVALGQALPPLPRMPEYAVRPVEQSMPGRRPTDTGRFGRPQ